MQAPDPAWTLIEDDSGLLAFLQRRTSARRCAVDLEADSLHHYGERICLVQIEAEGEIVLIDPIGGMNPQPLWDWLGQREVWMHGADYDMRLFQMAGVTLPNPLYDTQIAAQLVGRSRFGLAALIEEEFGVVLSKASQKADWAKRPLPEKMLVYAALDVHFLDELAGRLVDELQAADRFWWFLESCANARQNGLDRTGRDPDTVWRVGGWGKLSRRGLGYLRALWQWREEAAKEWDRPVFYLANNQRLIDWATELDQGEAPDQSRIRSRFAKSFEQAIASVRTLDPEELPQKRVGPRGPRRSASWEKDFERLRDYRNQVARRVGIDPGVLASRTALEGLVTEPERAKDLLMTWQREVLGIGPGWAP